MLFDEKENFGRLELSIDRHIKEYVRKKLEIIRNADQHSCKDYRRGQCKNGDLCALRHTKGDKSVVCKHWLRGLCKKSDVCEFLHEYDLNKMPPCYFFQTFAKCANPDCLFLHVSAEERIKDCPWYARGFCKHGPFCGNRHTRKIPCINYVAGFCPKGPNCENGHPKYELPRLNYPMKQQQIHQDTT